MEDAPGFPSAQSVVVLSTSIAKKKGTSPSRSDAAFSTRVTFGRPATRSRHSGSVWELHSNA